MSKILSLSHSPSEAFAYFAIVLVYGKELRVGARDINHLVEKICHLDKHESIENIKMDLFLNYALNCPNEYFALFQYIGNV